jgi:hypothetical protein
MFSFGGISGFAEGGELRRSVALYKKKNVG